MHLLPSRMQHHTLWPVLISHPTEGIEARVAEVIIPAEDGQPSQYNYTNWVRSIVTWLMETNALPLSHAANTCMTATTRPFYPQTPALTPDPPCTTGGSMNPEL